MASENANRADEKAKDVPLALLYRTMGGVALVWVVWWFFIISISPDSETAGQTGDIFGGINALFSGVAFAALIFTVHLQRKELRLQMQELAETREVLKEQRMQMELQNKTLTRQNLEGTFFQWLSLHHEIVRSTVIRRQTPIEGRVVMQHFHDVLMSRYTDRLPRQFADVYAPSVAEMKVKAAQRFSVDVGFDGELVNDIYADLYREHEDNFAHYFRNLYNLLKFLNHSELTDRQKRFYSNIVRAQLSSAELALLFYNGLSEWGKGSVELLETFAFFNNLGADQLMLPDHRRYYSERAYASTPNRFADGS